MKKTLTILFATFLFILLYPCHSYALNLSDLQKLALKNSRLLKAYTKEMLSEKNKFLFHRRDTYFDLSLKSSYEYSGSFSRSLGAELNIDLQKIFSNLAESNLLKLKKTKLLKALVKEKIKAQLSKYYIQLYILEKQKKFYKESLKFFKTHLYSLQVQLKRGLDISLDVARVQSRIKSIESKIRFFEQEKKSLIVLLSSLINKEIKTEEITFQNISTPSETIIFNPTLLTKYKDLKTSLQNFAENFHNTLYWQIENFNVKIAKSSYEQSRNYLWPNIVLGAKSNFIQDKQPWDDSYNFYLGASFPLSNFYKKGFQSKAYKEKYLAKKYLFEEFKRKFKNKITILFNKMKNFRKEYEYSLENKKKAKAALNLAFLQYRKGRIKETEVLSVYDDFIGVQENLLRNLLLYYNNRMHLSLLLKEYKK